MPQVFGNLNRNALSNNNEKRAFASVFFRGAVVVVPRGAGPAAAAGGLSVRWQASRRYTPRSALLTSCQHGR